MKEEKTEKIISKIKEILVEKLLVNPIEVTPEATLEDLGADSLDKIELNLEFQKEFKIQENMPEDLKNIKEIQDYILEKIF